MSHFVITVDGPAGTGKSTMASLLAERLGVRYLNTGVLYRAIAYHLDKLGVTSEDAARVEGCLKGLSICLTSCGVLVDGEDVGKELRTPRVDSIVSGYAALPSVRSALLGIQRSQSRYGSMIAEGRDMGTVVFPDAPLKFFLTASPEVRAERRCSELRAEGLSVAYEEVLAQIIERDKLDSSREFAPLKQPQDAVVVDTSELSKEEVLKTLEGHVQNLLPAAGGECA